MLLDMSALQCISELIRQRNEIDRQIGSILNRPVHPGHFGEFVASRIFDIELHSSAVTKASDGVFRSGPLKCKSVNIKFYTRNAGLLDLVASDDHLHHADYYLVLAGVKSGAISSANTHALWCIANVYLFSTQKLLDDLRKKPVKLGIATSVRKHIWAAAEIYPAVNNPDALITLSAEQISALHLFAPLPTG